MPEKLYLVGVVGAEPSECWKGGGCDDVVIGARGVVGVVASFEKPWRPNPTLTDWKVVILTSLEIADVVCQIDDFDYEIEKEPPEV